MIEAINKVKTVTRELVRELGREPSTEEIARRIDSSVDKVSKALKRHCQLNSRQKQKS